jgi:DNA-directed RNA polymerase subunit H (RpoH/RPB5)
MSEEHRYLPYVVYQNLLHFINYRKLELVSSNLTNASKTESTGNQLLSQDIFTQTLQYNKYVMLEAKDISSKDRRYPKEMHAATHTFPTKTIIILLDQEGSFINAAHDFTRLLNRVPHVRDLGHKFNMDIILISYNVLGTNIINKFEQYTRIGNESSGYIRMIPYEYGKFTFIPINHKLVPACRILSRSEESELLEKAHIAKKNCRKIRIGDAVSVWLGAELGDIIEEQQLSESSGIEVTYRVVRV